MFDQCAQIQEHGISSCSIIKRKEITDETIEGINTFFARDRQDI